MELLVATVSFLLLAYSLIKYLGIIPSASVDHLPGPRPLPILGNLIHVAKIQKDRPTHEAFALEQKKYGPIMGIKVGQNGMAVIEDFDLIRQVLNGDDWTDRLDSDYLKYLKFVNRSIGLLFATGAHWQEVRRFTVRAMKSFGFGKQQSMASQLSLEWEDIRKHLDLEISQNNGLVCFKRFFNVPALNVSWSYMCGQRFDWDDPQVKKLLDLNDILLGNNPMASNVGILFPKLSPILPKSHICRGFFREMKKFALELLNERRTLGRYTSEQNDFVDAYLYEMETKRAKNDPAKVFYSDEDFALIAADILSAGSETSANTLESAIICLALHPEVQRRVQEELDQVVGRDRDASYEDLHKLPYTEATLLEVHRITALIPINGRQAVRDTRLGGYHIPKGVVATMNFWAWHMNEEQWPNPRTFKPERFLNEKNQVVNGNKVLAFGQGKRVCIGETVAKATLFTFITNILHNYTLEPSEDDAFQKSWLKFHVGFTMNPLPFTARVKRR